MAAISISQVLAKIRTDKTMAILKLYTHHITANLPNIVMDIDFIGDNISCALVPSRLASVMVDEVYSFQYMRLLVRSRTMTEGADNPSTISFRFSPLYEARSILPVDISVQ